MKLEESLKLWEKYGLEETIEFRTLHFSELLIAKGDHDTGVVATHRDIREGKCSRTPNTPIQVVWLREENKFLVTDGYHRIVEAAMRGEEKISCAVEWTGYTLRFTAPTKDNRVNSLREIVELSKK